MGDWVAVAATYIGIPIFLMIWLGYRIVRKTHFVRYADMKFPPLPIADEDTTSRGMVPSAGE